MPPIIPIRGIKSKKYHNDVIMECPFSNSVCLNNCVIIGKHLSDDCQVQQNIILGRVLLTKLHSGNVELTNLRNDEMAFFIDRRKLVLTKIKQFTVMYTFIF